MSIADVYRQAVFNHFNGLHYPNWPLDSSYRLGDYGFITKGKLDKRGNLQDFKILVTPAPGRLITHQQFKSSQGVSVNFGAGAGAAAGAPVDAKAAVKVSFGAKSGAFVNAEGVRTTTIANYEYVAQSVANLARSGHWDDMYFVVTSITEAKKSIVAVSEAGGGSVVLEAKSPSAEQLHLSSVTLDLAVKSYDNVGFISGTEKGKQLLYLGFSRLQYKISRLFRPHFDVDRDIPHTYVQGGGNVTSNSTSSSGRMHNPDGVESGEAQLVRCTFPLDGSL